MVALRRNFALLLALQQVSPTLAGSISAAPLVHITPHAGSSQTPREQEAAALLQADSSHEAQSKMRPPNPAEWFGDFSQGESTYDYDGTLAGRHVNDQINVLDGWNPQQKNPLAEQAAPSQWFQESRSGAGKEAWQTFYPAVKTSVDGNEVQTGKWFTGKGGVWQQDYQSQVADGPGNMPASWFDDSVRQIDGFGRTKFPGFGSPRNYLDWEERSVNTSLACKAPGCTANVSLQAPFNSNTEMYKNCKLSVFFRPTDFDDWYSGEYVQWVTVNNRTISTKCHPHSDGCNQTAQRPLIPCVSDIEIDMLMPQNGALSIAAKIPDSVDECPYKGNMLSAVPTVTCLVSLKHKDGAPVPTTPNQLISETSCETKMPLQCATKGCAAEINMPVSASCAKLGQCMLSIDVNQTDFDNKDGTSELIEYIKVDGKQVAKGLKPGHNPCKSKWSGKPLQPSQMNFSALSNHAVNITSGRVRVEGKISNAVDECASNGFLFDAVATVRCGATGAKAAPVLLQTQKKVPVVEAPVATTHRRQLRGGRK